MRKPHLFIAALASAHLLLAALNAAHIPLFSEENIAGKTLRLYSEYSGADNAYSFFAPSVSAQTRVTFLMQDDHGRKAIDGLMVNNKEVNLRRTTTFSFFSMEEMRDLLTRSGAAMMFSCYPDATRVTVKVDLYDVPTMKNYRLGKRADWKMAYTNVFALNPK